MKIRRGNLKCTVFIFWICAGESSAPSIAQVMIEKTR